MSGWLKRVIADNESITAAGRWRTLRPLNGGGPVFTTADGVEVVSFASNDYLGLSQHPDVRAAAIDAVRRWGAGSGSARLIVGDRPVHHRLEDALAKWKGTEAALLFSSGFVANLGVLSAFATEGVLLVSDDRNHASIIDGCRLARAQLAISRHGDVGHVAELLAAHDGPAIVVTDAVFSMDGDLADLPALGTVCGDRGALLILDEAHAVLEPHWDPPAGLDLLRVGTLSKTLGSLGGFVAGARPFIEHLVNRARTFIFTTGSSPADVAAASAALDVLHSPAGAALIDRLRSHVHRIAPGHRSPILPVIIGDEQAAVAASDQLLADHGLLVPAIRPPTVAAGTSRLRIALSAAHSDDHLERLAKALACL
jgi:8-amino-7-oxononanoate synthase